MATRPAPVMPSHTVTWFPPGLNCMTLRPGDAVLVKHLTGSWFSRIPGYGIRFGQWLRKETRPAAWCDHSMLAMTGGPDAIIIQETPRGSITTRLNPGGPLANGQPYTGFQDDFYCVVSPQVSDDQRAAAVAFGMWTLGSGYGWLSLPSDGLHDITGLRISLGTYGRMVCSSQVCRAHERLGLIPDRDPTACQPANLAMWYGCDSAKASVVMTAYKARLAHDKKEHN